MTRGEIIVELMEIVARGTETMYAVVRFDHPIDTPTREQLIDGGLTVLNPIGGYSYIAAIDPWLVDPHIPSRIPNRGLRKVLPRPIMPGSFQDVTRIFA